MYETLKDCLFESSHHSDTRTNHRFKQLRNTKFPCKARSTQKNTLIFTVTLQDHVAACVQRKNPLILRVHHHTLRHTSDYQYSIPHVAEKTTNIILKYLFKIFRVPFAAGFFFSSSLFLWIRPPCIFIVII